MAAAPMQSLFQAAISNLSAFARTMSHHSPRPTMSETGFGSSPPIVIPERPLKKRRIYDSEASTPRESSPDELGVHGDQSPFPNRSGRPTHRDSNARRRSDPDNRSPSPDELDHTLYGGHEADARSERSRRHSSTPSSERSASAASASEATPGLRTPSPPPPIAKDVNYRLKVTLEGHSKGISQVRFSPDGRWIATCSADATIRIWDVTTGKHMQTFEGHLAGINTIAWSPDSKILASGSDDKEIRLWDRTTGKPHRFPLLGHHNYVCSLAFSPKGNMLVSGSYDEAVFLWDLRTGHQMRSLPAHSDPVHGVDFIRDGTLVCSCSTDGLIRIWDTATGQCLRTLVHEDNAPVVSCRFSLNGKFVLAWTLDGCIRLWDYVDSLCKKTYQGHENLKFSIGGGVGGYGREAFVVSGSEDGSIVLWDLKTKNIMQRLEGHIGPTIWVDAHPFDDIIVSGGLDGNAKIWVNEDEDYGTAIALKDETANFDTPDVEAESPEAVEY